jgi:uncharacterized protein (TIGR00725 family)
MASYPGTKAKGAYSYISLGSITSLVEFLNVGIAASSENSSRDIASRFVNSLPLNSRIILGGYWGMMREVAEAALERGIRTVFIVPDNPKAYPPKRREYVVIESGMDFRGRSVIICRSADVLVSLGGESGTIIEIFMAYAMGKPVVVLENTGMSSDKLKLAYPEYLDARRVVKVRYVATPEEAAREAIRASIEVKRLEVG